MASFKDTTGREWNVKLSGPLITEIRQLADPKFLIDDPIAEKTVDRMWGDLGLRLNVIYLLCRSQCISRNLSEFDFHDTVTGDGDTIDAATRAVVDGIFFSFPKQTRELLQAAAAKEQEIRQQSIGLVIEKLRDPNLGRAIVDQVSKQIDEGLQALSTPPASATGSQDSSASHQST